MNKKLLQRIADYLRDGEDDYEEISAEIEKELAKPEPEPVGYINKNRSGQVHIQDMNGMAFDICKHVGKHIYTTTPDQSARIAELEQKLIGYVTKLKPITGEAVVKISRNSNKATISIGDGIYTTPHDQSARIAELEQQLADLQNKEPIFLSNSKANQLGAETQWMHGNRQVRLIETAVLKANGYKVGE